MAIDVKVIYVPIAGVSRFSQWT